MVSGLQVFKEHFAGFTQHYLLIGGTACDLILQEAGLRFRATRDLDIVLCVEALNAAFVSQLRQFIDDGGYVTKEREADGTQCLYRFLRPQQDGYPYMLELFACKPEIMQGIDLGSITPVASEGVLVSLSAILLGEAYYGFIHSEKTLIDGISTVTAAGLIVLKAKAWLDLSERRERGERVNGSDIRKHKNDVFRLVQVLEPAPISNVPGTIRRDLGVFLAKMETEEVDLSQLGITRTTKEETLQRLQEVFGC